LKKVTPPGMAWLGPAGPMLMKAGLNSMLQKWKVTEYDESVTRSKLQEVRAALQKAGGDYLLQNRLTWAGALLMRNPIYTNLASAAAR